MIPVVPAKVGIKKLLINISPSGCRLPDQVKEKLCLYHGPKGANNYNDTVLQCIYPVILSLRSIVPDPGSRLSYSPLVQRCRFALL
jgi:hypothetical protein